MVSGEGMLLSKFQMISYNILDVLIVVVRRRMYAASTIAKSSLVPGCVSLLHLLPVIDAGARALHEGPHDVPETTQSQAGRSYSHGDRRSAQVRQNHKSAQLKSRLPSY